MTEAVELRNSTEWKNFQLEKQNELTSFLNQTKKNEFTEWNTIFQYVISISIGLLWSISYEFVTFNVKHVF